MVFTLYLVAFSVFGRLVAFGQFGLRIFIGGLCLNCSFYRKAIMISIGASNAGLLPDTTSSMAL